MFRTRTSATGRRWMTLGSAMAGVVMAVGGPVVACAAEAPNVVASIRPIHSLVAAVMEGVGAPRLLVQGGGSPHTYSLRPSDAGALQDADLVVWVGPGLEAFLADPLNALASDARILTLADVDGLTRLPVREGGAFEPHVHDHGEHGHDHDEHAHDHDEHAHDDEHEHEHDEAHEHAHDDEHDHAHDDEHDHVDHDEHDHADHDEHDHADHADHDEHDHADHDGHDHEHEHVDMHIWLDPGNAETMVAAIAETLADLDPAHAAQYLANAQTTIQDLDGLAADLRASLAPVQDTPFIVFHDAYHYFEHRFGVEAVGSITVTPGLSPGAARVQAMQEKVRESGAVCVFREPQFEPRLVGVVTEGTAVHTGTLDPIGADLAPGPDLYPTLIRNLGAAIADCLSRTE